MGSGVLTRPETEATERAAAGATGRTTVVAAAASPGCG